jgi:hypothetical protein
MQNAMQFLVFWALAFVTLSAALVILNLYCSFLGNEIIFRTLGQEAIIAGIASLVEAAAAWVILSFVPAAIRAMFIPGLIVAIIYKIAHLEDWSRFHLVLLFLFQIALGAVGACFYLGRVATGFMIIGVLVAVLSAVVLILRSFLE